MKQLIKILIVEDDSTIALGLKKNLEQWSFDVRCAKNFNNILEEFEDYAPSLVIMDIGLPAFNGYHWCSEIRNKSQVPIIFLSSRNDKMDIVMAMQMGGDDYIEKPFDIDVTIAKIQAVIRRTYQFTASMNEVNFAGTVLNLSTLILAYNKKTVLLTANEIKILKCLYLAQGEFVSREKIMDVLWQNNQFVDDNTLSVNITRLRKKLEGIGLFNFIENKKGLGYKLNENHGSR
ncbi:response regulator transcription factor [Treponema sp. OMZ 792]|uniref:response regulator transcription factor n=1 Tax=unclassified Treponema TaxID=2638727 RepID=UPI0020A2B579|nr:MULTISPECIES: response regulator transcription factor [unclassified Treponema]UTC74629.1 response regulator transcription factor [Treponema sp. OMZ 792]UTC77048.1 response regulator transcription factor [Treponema sp. OMZ 799]UTC81026.1 response regulator transcription factor [Treponema sp. OMZ 798]